MKADWIRQIIVASKGSILEPFRGGYCLIDYTLKRWPAMIRYAETGHLPTDNNPVENTIRFIALGKKNWLFAGSERADQRAAAIQTLLGTADIPPPSPPPAVKII